MTGKTGPKYPLERLLLNQGRLNRQSTDICVCAGNAKWIFSDVNWRSLAIKRGAVPLPIVPATGSMHVATSEAARVAA